jgi:ATP-dependent protease Clp ATPase subunit
MIMRCSFCARPAGVVKGLVAGMDAYICDVCLVACADLMKRAAEAGILGSREVAAKEDGSRIPDAEKH